MGFAPDQERPFSGAAGLDPQGETQALSKTTEDTPPQGVSATTHRRVRWPVDAIERRMGGLRRYILACIDEVSDHAIAMAAPRLSSQAARRFFERRFKLAPFNIEQVIADSGGEFMGDSANCSRTAISSLCGLIRKTRT